MIYVFDYFNFAYVLQSDDYVYIKSHKYITHVFLSSVTYFSYLFSHIVLFCLTVIE